MRRRRLLPLRIVVRQKGEQTTRNFLCAHKKLLLLFSPLFLLSFSLDFQPSRTIPGRAKVQQGKSLCAHKSIDARHIKTCPNNRREYVKTCKTKITSRMFPVEHRETRVLYTKCSTQQAFLWHFPIIQTFQSNILLELFRIELKHSEA